MFCAQEGFLTRGLGCKPSVMHESAALAVRGHLGLSYVGSNDLNILSASFSSAQSLDPHLSSYDFSGGTD